jgi:hypothetical protein
MDGVEPPTFSFSGWLPRRAAGSSHREASRLDNTTMEYTEGSRWRELPATYRALVVRNRADPPVDRHRDAARAHDDGVPAARQPQRVDECAALAAAG